MEANVKLIKGEMKKIKNGKKIFLNKKKPKI
jgi:hypothetical protein